MAAEQLLSTMKGVTPVTGTPQKPLPRDAFIDPRTGAERPINNPLTNPNYQKDLENSLKNAEINKQFVAVAESKTLSPEQKQVQMDTLRAQKTAMEGITPEMRTQYTAEMNLPQNLYAPPRDVEKEDATIARLGGAPTSDSEYSKMLVATYGKGGLEERGATVNANGLVSVIDPALLKASGFSDQQIESLKRASGGGSVYNPEILKAQGFSEAQIKALAPLGTQANQTPAPTNTSLGVLQEALRAAKGIGQPGFGVSDLMAQAGIATTGALGYDNLTNALEQRRAEMQQNYDSYADVITSTGGKMMDIYNGVMKQYNDALAGIKDLNDEARRVEGQMNLERERARLNREEFLFQEKTKAEIEAKKPDIQFVSGTENQPAGYFDKKTQKFTPLSVGGDAYGAAASSYSYGGTPIANGSAQYFATPVPHGSVNTTVVASNPKLIDLYKNGFQKALGANALAGQCAYEAEQWVDFNGKGWTVGNTLQDKAKSLDNFVKQGQAFYKGQAFGQVGNAIISNDDPKYGHVSVINAITDDGKYVVSEFNRAGSRVYTNNRILDPNDKSILGILKTVPKSEYQIKEESSVAAAATKAAGAIKDIFTGKKQGGLLDLLSAATTLGTKALVSAGKGAVDAKAKAEMDLKIQEGIKTGILDENGIPYNPNRIGIRSGNLPDTVITGRYNDLKSLIKKGLASPNDLALMEQDMIYGEQQREKRKLEQKYLEPASDAQNKAVGYAIEAQVAEGFVPQNSNHETLKAVNNWIGRYKGSDLIQDKVNELKTPAERALFYAELNFIGPILRDKSGAAITVEEYRNDGQRYFPRPGDTAEDLANKKKLRDTVIETTLLKGGRQGAEYWLNKGFDLPPAIAKQYGIEGRKPTSSAPTVPTSGTIIARGPDGKVYPIDAARWAKTSEEEKRQWTILN